MSRWNTNDKAKTTTSYEGGTVYHKDALEDWFNFLCTSMLSNQFYEGAEAQQARFIELTNAIGETYGWEFAAKAAVFARQELGMRSITHLCAAILNGQMFEEKRSFFKNIMRRPDDVAEVFAAIDALGGKRSHALVRGAGDYLSSRDAYTIGKYKMKGHKYNMYDLINITHANSSVIDAYKNDTLATPDTWETAISNTDNKDAEWARLVSERRLGYLALIRNLNNILVCRDIDVDELFTQITNSAAIAKSGVFPYQIYVAYKNLKVDNLLIKGALEIAFRKSVANMPEFDGENAIILDVSGSMDSQFGKTCLTIKETAAVYAIALWLQNSDTVLIKFGNEAAQFVPNYNANAFSIIAQYAANDNLGYGTVISSAFHVIDDMFFDRLFIFSDMQVMDARTYWSWGNDTDGSKNFKHWAACNNAVANCYSFDLSNYHTQLDNPNDPRIHLLSSLTDKTFGIIRLMETDGITLRNYIDDLSYTD